MTIKDFEHRAKLNGGYDREIDEWKIIDIHKENEPVIEMDFYCNNGKKVYLLRLRNSEVERYTIFADKEHTQFGHPPYLVAELPVLNINNDFIRQVLLEFGEL